MFLKIKSKIRKMSENNIPNEINEEIQNQMSEVQDELEVETSETEALKAEIQKEKDQYLRLFAEFDNFKKRTAKERFEIFKTANSEVILALLPVLDDFERAIKELEKRDQEDLKGVQLIQSKLTEILRGKGLKALDIQSGNDFDTDTMEAITQIPAPTDDLKGKVVDVVETGYSLNEKVIRFAKVVIGQ